MGNYLGRSPVKIIKRSRNLIPYPYYETTKTMNGIIFTDNGDGSITVNGTATADAYIILMQRTKLLNGTYSMSGCPSGGSWKTYFITYNGYNVIKNDCGDGGLFGVDDVSPQTNIVFIVRAGYIANNLVCKPMLNKGETALPYEPYNQLWRVRSGALIRNPKNWIPTIPDRTFNDNSKGQFESKNGVITFGGILTEVTLSAVFNVISKNTWVANYTGYYKLTKDDLNISAGTYTISMRVTAGEKHEISILFGKVNTQVIDSTATRIYLKPLYTTVQDEIITKTFTVNETMKFAVLGNLVVNASGVDTGMATISEIMLNKGTTAEPYFVYD